MSKGFVCSSFFQKIRAFFKSRNDNAGQNIASKSLIDFHQLFYLLDEFENNSADFISVIIGKDWNSVYLRLFYLETFVDQNKFLDTLIALTREDVDNAVPYEFQNVRAYFYYLILKARIREHQNSFRITEITDGSRFSFNFETIIFEIRECARFMASLVIFYPFCEASVHFNLTESIFVKRTLVYHELFCNCLILFFFILIYGVEYTHEILLNEIVSALKYFNKAIESYNSSIDRIKVAFGHENKIKSYSRNIFWPLLTVFQWKYALDPSKIPAEDLIFLQIKDLLEKFLEFEPNLETHLGSLIDEVEKKLRVFDLKEKLHEKADIISLESNDISRDMIDQGNKTAKKRQRETKLFNQSFNKHSNDKFLDLREDKNLHDSSVKADVPANKTLDIEQMIKQKSILF